MDKGVLKCKNLGKSIAKTPTKIVHSPKQRKVYKNTIFYKKSTSISLEVTKNDL